MRAVEHRLQLFWDRQVHALPASAESRAHLARVLGYRDGPTSTALARFEADLVSHQTTARSIHERLFFRPLLEAFTTRHRVPMDASAIGRGRLRADVRVPVDAQGAGSVRMAGPARDGRPAGSASSAPTGGSDGADGAVAAGAPPALLSETRHRRAPDRVRFLGRQAHTGRRLGTDPGLLADLPPDASHGAPGPRLAVRSRPTRTSACSACAGWPPGPTAGPSSMRSSGSPPRPPVTCASCSGRARFLPAATSATRNSWLCWKAGRRRCRARRSSSAGHSRTIAWRHRSEWWRGLASLQRSELLRAQARDVLGLEDVAATGRSLACLAEAVLEVALWAVAGPGIGANGLRQNGAKG